MHLKGSTTAIIQHIVQITYQRFRNKYIFLIYRHFSIKSAIFNLFPIDGYTGL